MTTTPLERAAMSLAGRVTGGYPWQSLHPVTQHAHIERARDALAAALDVDEISGVIGWHTLELNADATRLVCGRYWCRAEVPAGTRNIAEWEARHQAVMIRARLLGPEPPYKQDHIEGKEHQ